MTELLQLDEQLFRLINSGMSNSFFDWLMPYWRSKLFWIPLYVFLISFLLMNFKKAGVFVLIGVIFTIALADFTSSNLVKKNVKRIRPCNEIHLQDSVKERIKCGGGYSFTSSHATNHFALATFLIFVLGSYFKWIKVPLYLWAASISFGQVYVGVHYPFDVIAGALLGIFLGFISYRFYSITGFNKLPDHFKEIA